MRYFETPPRTLLSGEIPGELQYEIWANEKDQVFIGKIRDLPQEAVDANMIYINVGIAIKVSKMIVRLAPEVANHICTFWQPFGNLVSYRIISQKKHSLQA